MMRFVEMKEAMIQAPVARNFAGTVLTDIKPCDAMTLEPTLKFCFRNGTWVFDYPDC